MGYQLADFIPGAVPMACSICGRRRKFPDQIEKSDDGLFRCLDACAERTAFSIDRERAAWRAAPEQIPPVFGPSVHRPTFLEESQQLQAVRIGGWTPTTTFYDDFSTVPGGVGSSWTTSLHAGTGSFSSPSAGVARLNGGSVQVSMYLPLPTVSIPSFLAGRFYSRMEFALDLDASLLSSAAQIGVSSTVAGSPSGAFSTLSSGTAAQARFFTSGTSMAGKFFEVVNSDPQQRHFVELWWDGDGYMRSSMNNGRTIETGVGTSLTNAVPWMRAIFGCIVDIYNIVYMV